MFEEFVVLFVLVVLVEFVVFVLLVALLVFVVLFVLVCVTGVVSFISLIDTFLHTNVACKSDVVLLDGTNLNYSILNPHVSSFSISDIKSVIDI